MVSKTAGTPDKTANNFVPTGASPGSGVSQRTVSHTKKNEEIAMKAYANTFTGVSLFGFCDSSFLLLI